MIVITLHPWPEAWQSHGSRWEHFSLRQSSRYIWYFTSGLYVLWKIEALRISVSQNLNIMWERARGIRALRSLLMKGNHCSLRSQQMASIKKKELMHYRFFHNFCSGLLSGTCSEFLKCFWRISMDPRIFSLSCDTSCPAQLHHILQ